MEVELRTDWQTFKIPDCQTPTLNILTVYMTSGCVGCFFIVPVNHLLLTFLALCEDSFTGRNKAKCRAART